ncbi:MAG TPA: nucleotidyl transferase AbiEii/AbiGii toxin family protein [Solirubrobacteraceae bacterium]|nr:nucleotidyl transferase AbiEii/AbiGii toxin family protein [Solirubrobacteraceae bacterium]
MSVYLLEQAAAALGPLCAEVVFLGGASIALWMTDPGAPAPRPTKDVDVVVDIASRLAYEQFSERMRAQGFAEDSSSAVICRWRHASRGLLLDAMPVDPAILVLANRWHAAAVVHADTRTLPSGASIRAATPPFLLATKLEAFSDRGRSDPRASRDLEDIVTLLDTRAELMRETDAAPADVRAYIAAQLVELQKTRDFLTILAGMLRPDDASQARLEVIVLPRLRELAAS